MKRSMEVCAAAALTAAALGAAACSSSSANTAAAKPAATKTYESQYWYKTFYDPTHHIVEEVPQGPSGGGLATILQFCVGKELVTATSRDQSYNEGASAQSQPFFAGCADLVLTPDDLGITNYSTLTN